MRLDFRGFDQVTAYLKSVATRAPDAAHQGVQRGLDTVGDELRMELAQADPKVVTRTNNKYTQFSVGRRTVSVTFPGLNFIGWIAVTGLEAGSFPRIASRFTAQAQANDHARKYADAIRREENEAEIRITVTTGPDGATGTLTAEREDDDATQRAFDASEETAGQAAEDEIRKRLVV